MRLAELERYFASVATSTAGPPDDLEAVFKDGPQLPARALLGIYNRGYHYRLLGALASVFPRTKRALGEEAFERAGLGYIAAYPSVHPAVERVGRAFPEYLRALPTVRRELAELAELECARLRALVSPPCELALPSAIDPSAFPSSSFSFVPSLSTLSLSEEALALFSEHGSAPSTGQVRVVAVWREGDVVRQQALEPLELAALELARAGASLSHICARFDSGTENEAAQRAFAVISSWFERKWLAARRP